MCHTLDEAIRMMMHRQSRDGRVRVLMLYDKDELMHEIASMSYVEADTAIQQPDNAVTDAAVHNYKEVAEEENWPLVNNYVNLAVTEVEQMILTLTKHNSLVNRSMSNWVDTRREWAIEMHVKPEASDTTVTLIMNLANEYIKAKVLKEWSGMTYQAATAYWEKQCKDLEDKIREAGRSCESIHSIRRPMWPAW